MIASTILFLGLLAQIKATLPPGFPQCHKNDPGLNKCLLEATDHPIVRENLLHGIPKIGFPKITPLHVHELTLEEKGSSFNFKSNLNHILFYGTETYQFSKFDFDVPNLKFFCTCNMGPLYMEGDYDVKGKVILIPIEGNGKFHANITKAHIDLVHEVKITKKGDVEHLTVVGTKTKLKLDDLKFSLHGLLGGSEVLENALQSAFDNSQEDLIMAITPALQEGLNSIVDTVFGQLFDGLSYKALFPDKH